MSLSSHEDQTLTINLPTDLKADIDRVAAAAGMSRDTILSQAVANGLSLVEWQYPGSRRAKFKRLGQALIGTSEFAIVRHRKSESASESAVS